MDQDFSIHQRSTETKEQPSKPSETTAKSKDITTFFNKERDSVVCACSKKKSLR